MKTWKRPGEKSRGARRDAARQRATREQRRAYIETQRARYQFLGSRWSRFFGIEMPDEEAAR